LAPPPPPPYPTPPPPTHPRSLSSLSLAHPAPRSGWGSGWVGGGWWGINGTVFTPAFLIRCPICGRFMVVVVVVVVVVVSRWQLLVLFVFGFKLRALVWKEGGVVHETTNHFKDINVKKKTKLRRLRLTIDMSTCTIMGAYWLTYCLHCKTHNRTCSVIIQKHTHTQTMWPQLGHERLNEARGVD